MGRYRLASHRTTRIMKIFVALSTLLAAATCQEAQVLATYAGYHPYAAAGYPYAAAPYAAYAPYSAGSQFHAQDEFGNLNYGYTNINPVFTGVAPEPVQDTPEVIEARAAHLAAVEAAKAGERKRREAEPAVLASGSRVLPAPTPLIHNAPVLSAYHGLGYHGLGYHGLGYGGLYGAYAGYHGLY